MQDSLAIKVTGITKSFRIPLDGKSGIKQHVINVFRHRKGYRDFKPLNDISFEIKKGEFFGIVGRNGSGKSTLLKLIAGIYAPDEGSIKVNGLLVPFIELGVGFNPELTGRENVFLNAALLGFSRKETTAIYEEIVDFAELHDFMEEKLKNYSSGMQVRLAFSIAIRAKGDILLLDEVLAVGDSAFQQKCFDYFERMKEDERKTIILVTHSMETVKRFCSSALLLEEGRVKMRGSPEKIADQYTIDNITSHVTTKAGQDSGLLKTLHAKLSGNEFTRQDTMRIDVDYRLAEEAEIMVGIAVVKDGKSIAELNSKDVKLKNSRNVLHRTRLELDLSRFTQGLYSVNVAVFKKDTQELLELRTNVGGFVIKGDDQTRGGAVFIEGPWVSER